MDMEEETRRELASLQREKELLQSKEKENEDAIDEVRRSSRLWKPVAATLTHKQLAYSITKAQAASLVAWFHETVVIFYCSTAV